MSCHRNYGIVDYPACSNHASACINDQCMCFPGWTGIGDFLTAEGYDCDIHKNTIVIWSYFNLALSLISLATMIYCLYHENFFRWESKKLFYQKLRSTKCQLFLSSTAVPFFSIILEVAKIYDQERFIVGRSFIMSLSVILTVSSLVYAGTIYVHVLGDFLKSYSRFMNTGRKDHFTNTVARLERTLDKVPIVILFLLTVALLPPVVLPDKYMEPFSIMFPLTATIGYMIYGLSTQYILHVFLSEIRIFFASRKDESVHLPTTASEVALRAIYNKIHRGNKILVPFFISGIFFNILFLSWNFLRRKATYFNIFQVTFMQLLGPFVGLSLKKISKEEGKLTKLITKSTISNNLLSMLPPTVWTSPSRSKKVTLGHSMFRSKKVQCKTIVVKQRSEADNEENNLVKNVQNEVENV